jgi:hypothetical protein
MWFCKGSKAICSEMKHLFLIWGALSQATLSKRRVVLKLCVNQIFLLAHFTTCLICNNYFLATIDYIQMQYQSVNQLVSLDAIDDHSNFIFSSIEYFILNNIIFI